MSHERRIFLSIPPTIELGSAAAILHMDGQTKHHLTHVLRLPPGSKVTVADSHTGQAYSGTLLVIDSEMRVQLIDKLPHKLVTTGVDTLLFALCKGSHNDEVCEKATELGINSICFFQADRSVVVVKNSESKLSRWNKIAEAASRQSGRSTIPRITSAGSLREAISGLPLDNSLIKIVGSLAAQAVPLAQLHPFTASSCLLIGPEGDFSPAEEEILLANEFKFISFGAARLRSETAALAGTAMIQALYGLKNRPPL